MAMMTLRDRQFQRIDLDVVISERERSYRRERWRAGCREERCRGDRVTPNGTDGDFRNAVDFDLDDVHCDIDLEIGHDGVEARFDWGE